MTLNYTSRSELGWPPSAAPNQTAPVEGFKIHYEGSPVPIVDHSKCAGRWTSIRNSHLANTAEGYSDVAYNWAVCNHGGIFEGRGWGKQTGANGSASLNRTHNAILWMGGTSGVVAPSAAAVESIKELIAYLRPKGAGRDILGHRDGFATACPGDAMYTLVRNGSLEPSVPTPPQEEPETVTPFSYHLATDHNYVEGVTRVAFGPNAEARIHGAGVKASSVVHILFETVDDATIDGYFFYSDPDGTNESNLLAQTRHGGGGHTFIWVGEVPTGKHLRFKFNTDRPGKILHRHNYGVTY